MLASAGNSRFPAEKEKSTLTFCWWLKNKTNRDKKTKAQY
jgi:hypothetical protein